MAKTIFEAQQQLDGVESYLIHESEEIRHRAGKALGYLAAQDELPDAAELTPGRVVDAVLQSENRLRRHEIAHTIKALRLANVVDPELFGRGDMGFTLQGINEIQQDILILQPDLTYGYDEQPQNQ